MAGEIPFIDLAAQRRRLGKSVEDAILKVVDHCGFVMGPEIGALEAELSAFCGARHVISCANGTDALGLILMAKGVKPGDAVFCPSFTFAATAEVIAWMGATPVFIDIHEDTFNLDPASFEDAIATARWLRLNPVGLISVDLFGLPADYDAIEPICAREGLWLLSDAAQSFGAVYKGRKVGTIGMATATSFFPAKPLGCYGDGGAVFTDDDELAAVMRSLRIHGQGTDKYDNVRIGINGRLDTIQAAVLIEKLRNFCGRDRRPRPHRRALQRAPAPHGHRARGARRSHVGVGAIHAAHSRLRPRCLSGGSEDSRHSNRGLLCQAPASADRLRGVSDRSKWSTGVRAPRR
jgi:dTDP-4-amino-4,6-dideoxygalactose transaminase